MKKFSLFLLLILCSFTLTCLTVTASEEITEIAGAKYQVTEVAEQNDLPYGVVHTRNIGQTSTSISGYDADGYGGYSDIVVPGQYYSQQVNVLEVPSSSNVRVTTWANLNGHKWTLTTVRGMINDYEAKNTGWKVIAAINGDFFDINGKGNLPFQTSGALVSNGEFYKTTTGNLVGFTNDGSIDSLIGNENVQKTQNMKLAVYNQNNEIVNEFNIEKINQTPLANETAIYFANYDETKNIIPLTVEVGTSKGYFVNQAELALPNTANDFYGKGTISSLTSSTPLDKGQFAIVTNNPTVQAALGEGIEIRCQYEYIGAYENVNDISGAGSTILINGEDNPDGGLTDRAPRTVIGRKTDGTLVLMVIDGRQASKNMYGADRTELSAIMKSYDCVEAYNLDGGGSSTVVIRRDGNMVVMNSPSDGKERTDSNCILVVAKDPEIETTITNVTTNSFTINSSVLATNGHDIKEMMVKVGDNLQSLSNGDVTFSNLDFNTNYLCQFYYKDTLGELQPIIQTKKVLTLKRTPEFIGIKVLETPDKFEIEVLYIDPDRASTIGFGTIYVNGKRAFLNNGKTAMKKESIGTEITSINLNYSYNINDGIPQMINLSDIEFTVKLSVEIPISIIIEANNLYIIDIYQ